MKLHEQKVPENWNLFLVGDFHIGSILHFDEGLDQLIESVCSKYKDCKRNLVLLHGDLIECITPDDPRFDINMTRPMFLNQQIEFVTERLQPIRKHIIGSMEGNHEQKVWRYGNVAEQIADSLLVPFLTYSCKITYKDTKGIQFKHFANHGFGSINSVADDIRRQKTNMKLTLKRKLKKKFGDALLCSCGHTHKLLINKPVSELYLTDDGETIHQNYTKPVNSDFIHPDHKYYVNTGSLMKLYVEGFSGYAERAGYDPIELGYAVVTIRNREIQDVDKVILHE